MHRYFAIPNGSLMMIRALVALSALLTIQYSHGQSYVPFPTDSAEWMVERYVYITGSQSTITYSAYRMLGDTVVNDTLYHKLYQFLGANPSTSTLVSGFREEDRRVYARLFGNANVPLDCQWPPDTDLLLYDFNLDEPGDSLIIQHPWLGEVIHVVNDIDSVLVDNTYRRRLNCYSLSNNCGPMPFTYIEGVGSFRHPLDPFMLQDYEHFFVLACFKTEGTFRYSSLQTPHCDWATVGIEADGTEARQDFTARVVNGEIIVNSSSADGVQLIDALGRVLTDVQMRGGQMSIPVIDHHGLVFVRGYKNGRPLGHGVPVVIGQ